MNCAFNRWGCQTMSSSIYVNDMYLLDVTTVLQYVYVYVCSTITTTLTSFVSTLLQYATYIVRRQSDLEYYIIFMQYIYYC